MGVGQVNEVSGWLGIAPQNVDELTVLFDKSLPDAATTGFADGAPQFGVLVRNSGPIDIEAAITKLTQRIKTAEVQEFEGVQLIVSPGEGACFAFINDSMFLVGQVDFVKKMITAKEQVESTSALTKRLEAAGNRLFVLAVDGVATESALKLIARDIPPPISLFSAYFLGAKELSILMDLDAAEFMQLNLQFKKPELATGLYGILDQQWTWAKGQYEEAKGFMSADPFAAPLQPYSDQLIAETQLTQADDTLSFTIPKIKDLDQLPERMKPAIEAARKAAENAKRMNGLKQIGLAFHNYHDVYNHFPAFNGSGQKDQPHPGLSWRVHILPFIEEASLYNQFKLDEAWDSEHNKPLIAKMPKLYGTNAEGKTSYHVITGKGAPFQKDAGIGLRDITDGTSNTILVVETGEDVADIWTKPGALEFNPEDPLKCIGAAFKEFSFLMMDGSVRRSKDIKPETFSKLVQHADGEVIGDF